MEFICSKEDIQKHLSYAENIVSTRTTITILSNVLLETIDGGVLISSTDLEVGYRSLIPADVKVSGNITIQAKKLSEIIKSFSNCNLVMKLDSNNKMKINSESPNIKANFQIMGQGKDDFPEVPKFKEDNVFSLEQESLKSMIRKTIFSASTDESRYFLNGIYFERKENQLILVATDGKRLSYIETELEGDDIADFNVIIPYKVLNELVKVLESEGLCDISLSENKVFFKFNDTELVSNLLEGQFPNYNQVVPSQSDKIMKVNKQTINEAIKRVSSMVDPKLSQVKFELNNGVLKLYGYHPDFGTAEDEVEVEYKGEEIVIAFNYTFVLDALKEIDQDDVYFKFTNNKQPVLITGLEDHSYFSVVMPMKLAEE